MKLKSLLLTIAVVFITLFYLLFQVAHYLWMVLGWLKFWGQKKARELESAVILPIEPTAPPVRH